MSLSSLLFPSSSPAPLSSLFSCPLPPTPTPAPAPAPTPDDDPLIDPKASALQIKDRKSKTIFVGNVSLEASRKKVEKYFSKFGKVEKVWERSVPVEEEGKRGVKGKIIGKMLRKDADSKNCYVLFSEKEAVEKALTSNGEVFMDRHLRVDSADEKKLDYESTLFIGNLPFNITEEELRKHFEPCGEIFNVRVIRDSKTHVGKGFGYVYFKSKDGYKNGLTMNFTNLKERVIRVKKALDENTLERKKLKKVQKERKTNAERRISQKGKNKNGPRESQNLDEHLQNFAKNSTIEQNEIEDVQYKNIVTLDQRKIKNKLKKMNAGQAEKTKVMISEKSKLIKKHDKNLFNDVNMLKKRKDQRKKKQEFNKQRSFRQKRTDLKK